MTTVWIALIALGALAGLAAGAWLIVIAFRESIGWGIACLFGIPAVVFVVRYWEDVKVPFAYALTGFVIAVVGTVGYSVSSVNADLDSFTDFDDSYAWEARPLSLPDEPDTTESVETEAEVDEPTADGTDDSTQTSPDEGDNTPPETTAGEPGTQRTPVSIAERRRGYLVALDKLEAYEGERIVITLKNGERIFVYVVDVRDHDMEVRRSVGGGSVTFDVRISEIEEVRARRVL